MNVEASRVNVAAASQQGTSFSGLISGGTYYFRIWTKDDVGNYSPLSVGATNWATIAAVLWTLLRRRSPARFSLSPVVRSWRSMTPPARSSARGWRRTWVFDRGISSFC